MAASCAFFVSQAKAILSPTYYVACLAIDGITVFYYLWKKYAEKAAAKALRAASASS